MHIALISIKSLLVKWAIVYAVSLILLGGMTVHAQTTDNSNERTKKEAMQQKKKLNKAKTSKKPKAPKKTVKRPKNVHRQPAPAPAQTPRIKTAQRSVPQRPTINVTHVNTYAPGNCTWYAKSKRPDLPNNLGNANSWTARAKAQGIPTGVVPKEGAIAQRGNHVVYVEKVNNDGTITFSEMNFVGLGKISRRTDQAGTFKYIYL